MRVFLMHFLNVPGEPVLFFTFNFCSLKLLVYGKVLSLSLTKVIAYEVSSNPFYLYTARGKKSYFCYVHPKCNTILLCLYFSM